MGFSDGVCIHTAARLFSYRKKMLFDHLHYFIDGLQKWMLVKCQEKESEKRNPLIFKYECRIYPENKKTR